MINAPTAHTKSCSVIPNLLLTDTDESVQDDICEQLGRDTDKTSTPVVFTGYSHLFVDGDDKFKAPL